MTMDKLTIPDNLQVGYQKRQGTYTGKLAYVTFIDTKGKHRKEASWNSWRDQKIDPDNFTNEPTEGFVLNKKVGDYRGSWFESRSAWVRVYDPRGFEFEIGVDNLLFILQETSCIKGKGLEGEFVYAWSGKDLVLLPCGSVDYQESVKFTALQTKKVTKKDMVPGCVYLNKDNDEVIYLGREFWYEYDSSYYSRTWKLVGNQKHIFKYVNEKDKKPKWNDKDDEWKYWVQTGFTKIGTRLTEEVDPKFAGIFEEFKKSRMGSLPTGFVHKKKNITLGKKDDYGRSKEYKGLILKNNKYYAVRISEYTWYNQPEDRFWYMWTSIVPLHIEDNTINFNEQKSGDYEYYEYSHSWYGRERNQKVNPRCVKITQEELDALDIYDLYATNEAGGEYQIEIR